MKAHKMMFNKYLTTYYEKISDFSYKRIDTEITYSLYAIYTQYKNAMIKIL